MQFFHLQSSFSEQALPNERDYCHCCSSLEKWSPLWPLCQERSGLNMMLECFSSIMVSSRVLWICVGLHLLAQCTAFCMHGQLNLSPDMFCICTLFLDWYEWNITITLSSRQMEEVKMNGKEWKNQPKFFTWSNTFFVPMTKQDWLECFAGITTLLVIQVVCSNCCCHCSRCHGKWFFEIMCR